MKQLNPDSAFYCQIGTIVNHIPILGGIGGKMRKLGELAALFMVVTVAFFASHWLQSQQWQLVRFIRPAQAQTTTYYTDPTHVTPSPVSNGQEPDMLLLGPYHYPSAYFCAVFVCNNVVVMGPYDVTGYSVAHIQFIADDGNPGASSLQAFVSDDPNCSTAKNWEVIGGTRDNQQVLSGALNGSDYVEVFQAMGTSPNLGVANANASNNSNIIFPLNSHCFEVIAGGGGGYFAGNLYMQGVLRKNAPFRTSQLLANYMWPINPQFGVATLITKACTGTTGSVACTATAATGYGNFVCSWDVEAKDTGAGTVAPITVTGMFDGNANSAVTMTYAAIPKDTNGNMILQVNYGTPCRRLVNPFGPSSSTFTVTTTADPTASAVSVNIHGINS